MHETIPHYQLVEPLQSVVKSCSVNILADVQSKHQVQKQNTNYLHDWITCHVESDVQKTHPSAYVEYLESSRP